MKAPRLIPVSLGVRQVELRSQAVFFAVLAFAHRARWAAPILLRAAADIVRFLGIVLFPFTFAHLAR